MQFSLSPEQQELQAKARTLADEEFRPRAARVDQTRVCLVAPILKSNRRGGLERDNDTAR